MTLAAFTPPPPGEAGLYALAGRPQRSRPADDRRWPGARRRGRPDARAPGRRDPADAQRTDPDSLPRSAAHRPSRTPGTSARQSRTSLSGRLRLAGKPASCPHKFGDHVVHVLRNVSTPRDSRRLIVGQPLACAGISSHRAKQLSGSVDCGAEDGEFAAAHLQRVTVLVVSDRVAECLGQDVR